MTREYGVSFRGTMKWQVNACQNNTLVLTVCLYISLMVPVLLYQPDDPCFPFPSTHSYGPLVHHWTMRFEAKHGYFKRLAQSLGNFINLPHSLAMRHQHLQCYWSTNYQEWVLKLDQVCTFTCWDNLVFTISQNCQLTSLDSANCPMEGLGYVDSHELISGLLLKHWPVGLGLRGMGREC